MAMPHGQRAALSSSHLVETEPAPTQLLGEDADDDAETLGGVVDEDHHRRA
ncbi:hypothetical protein [Georgenia sp. Z1491]|uniref:hypothetical protein n=1 Tax=Georgenia sp. Z1491 TaxID=3416707 RepID=UPI003CF0276E